MILILLFSLCFAASPVKHEHPFIQVSLEQICSKENQDYAELRYPEQIPYCSRNVSLSLKNKIYAQYGIPTEDRVDYTIDHIIPLSIGGTNHPKNLWPEHKSVKALRQNLEMDVYTSLRSGKITQSDAIKLILEVKYRFIKYPFENAQK